MFYFLKFNLNLLESPFDCIHPSCTNNVVVSFVIESISILILNLHEKRIKMCSIFVVAFQFEVKEKKMNQILSFYCVQCIEKKARTTNIIFQLIEIEWSIPHSNILVITFVDSGNKLYLATKTIGIERKRERENMIFRWMYTYEYLKLIWKLVLSFECYRVILWFY